MRFQLRSPKPRPTAEEQIRELVRSRRSIADAYEVERRRIERDLHDGAQQHLVAAAMSLGEARFLAQGSEDASLTGLLQEAEEHLSTGLASLRATVRGIHPRVLEEKGLVAALDEVAGRYGPHVRITSPHPLPTLPEPVLAAAYFFAAEALTNAAKYASGVPVSVLITADQVLSVSVVDQGPGGAHMVEGSGLAGMKERLAAFGGSLELSSPVGGPTRVVGRIPLMVEPGVSGIGAAE